MLTRRDWLRQNIESKFSQMYCSIKKVYAKIELLTAVLLDVEGIFDRPPGQLAKSDQLTICQSTQDLNFEGNCPSLDSYQYTKK
jgi:hypothetical protein